MTTAPRHFLDLDALAPSDLRSILDEAMRRKQARVGLPKGAPDADAPLVDHALAMLFEKSSTRTRVSFDVGMRQLGGSTLVLNSGDLQLGRGETVEDTARVLSRMVDAVMVRANSHDDVLKLADASDVPVINGLTDRSHPCQIVADLMTLEERFGDLKGRTLAWVGDGNNVATSFLHAASLMGYDMRLACPDAYAPDPDEVRGARDRQASVTVTQDVMEAVTGADVVIADTWVSMGDEDIDARMAALKPYQVTEAVMEAAGAESVFLHCLPAHRGEEMTADVIDGPRSLVWDEAENRLHAQKAILLWCLAS